VNRIYGTPPRFGANSAAGQWKISPARKRGSAAGGAVPDGVLLRASSGKLGRSLGSTRVQFEQGAGEEKRKKK